MNENEKNEYSLLSDIENAKNERLFYIISLRMGIMPRKITDEKKYYFNNLYKNKKSITKNEKDIIWKTITNEEKKIVSQKFKRAYLSYIFKKKILKQRIKKLQREGNYKNL